MLLEPAALKPEPPVVGVVEEEAGDEGAVPLGTGGAVPGGAVPAGAVPAGAVPAAVPVGPGATEFPPTMGKYGLTVGLMGRFEAAGTPSGATCRLTISGSMGEAKTFERKRRAPSAAAEFGECILFKV